jgi:hypothetical protein
MRTCLLSWALAIALPRIASADAPVPESVGIEAVEHAGNGCPPGTATASISEDRRSLTVAFSAHVAELPPHAGASRAHSACTLQLALATPSGWSVAATSFDLRGFVLLEEGVRAWHEARYQLSPGSKEVRRTNLLGNIFGEELLIRDEPLASGPEPASCGKGRKLRIRSALTVERDGGSHRAGVVTVDSVDGVLLQTFHLEWSRCR